MARKAIRGYTEKSYYDNTTFKGIVASSDPLNEGNFAHLVNFDISDTGNSLKPRHGFLTTDIIFKDDSGYNTLKLKADTTVYFYDHSIQKYIFVDFSTFKYTNESIGESMQDYTYTIDAYAVTFELSENVNYVNRRFTATKITNVDVSDLMLLFNPKEYDDYREFRIFISTLSFEEGQAQYIQDENSITKYILKRKIFGNLPYSWIEVYYRKKGSGWYEGEYYEDDTLVVSYVNTEDIVTIDSSQRNIASTQSVIPSPMQKIYDKDSTELTYNQFPMIYIKDNTNGKYLLQTSKTIDTTFIPYYLLREPEEGYTWAYTYDIISTSKYSSLTTSNVYSAPLFTLKDNKKFIDSFEFDVSSYASYLQMWQTKVCYMHSALSDAPFYTTMQSSMLAGGDSSSLYLEQFDEHMLPDLLSDLYMASDDKFLKSDYVNNSLLIHIAKRPDHTVTLDKDDFVIAGHSFHDFITTINNKVVGTVEYSCIRDDDQCIKLIETIQSSNCTIDKIIEIFKKYDWSSYHFRVTKLSDINKSYTLSQEAGIYNNIRYTRQYAFTSGILVEDSLPMDVNEIIDVLNNNSAVYFKFMKASIGLTIDPLVYYETDGSTLTYPLFSDARAQQVFPNLFSHGEFDVANEIITTHKWYIYTSDYTVRSGAANQFFCNTLHTHYEHEHLYNYFYAASRAVSNGVAQDNTYYTSIPLSGVVNTYLQRKDDDTIQYPWMDYYYVCTNGDLVYGAYQDDSVFEYKDNVLQFKYNETNLVISKLKNTGYFDTGISIVFYIIPVMNTSKMYELEGYNFNIYNRAYLVSTTSLFNTRQFTLDSSNVLYITERLEEDPLNITNASGWCIFHSEQGDRLVTWINNKVYMSEANKYYYFKETGTHTYPEKVLKVIQFKNTLLVFTTINLYSIYPYEDTTLVENGKDEEGNTQYVQSTVIIYATLPVLYNLMLTPQYLDAIQVFNQMVLFYSADGQLFMIKPTATIDNDTKFTIQYFNKSANNILLHYDEYMNARLLAYESELHIENKEDIKIKVQVTLNYIKIFYMYESYTYILVYDVINNYYYVYDTMSFSNVKNILFTECGDTYVSSTSLNDNKYYLYFTVLNNIPNTMDNNKDEAVYNHFADEPIHAELDTGVLNLNNHLKKRFRNLYTTYKNISATYLLYTLESYIDDILAQSTLADSMSITNINSKDMIVDDYACVHLQQANDLLNSNTALFDFSLFTSNKILTHYANIPCLGKQFRLRLRFTSKGNYKLQSYGVTFKEHQI